MNYIDLAWLLAEKLPPNVLMVVLAIAIPFMGRTPQGEGGGESINLILVYIIVALVVVILSLLMQEIARLRKVLNNMQERHNQQMEKMQTQLQTMSEIVKQST